MSSHDAKNGGLYLTLLIVGGLIYSEFQSQERSQPIYHADTQKWTFAEFDCKEAGCKGHVAGYKWAMKNAVESEAQCHSSSRSFEEGCITFVDGYLEWQHDRQESSDADFIN